jgi:hypothetical protein
MTRVSNRRLRLVVGSFFGFFGLLAMFFVASPLTSALPSVACSDGSEPQFQTTANNLEITCATGTINGFAPLNAGGFDVAATCPADSQMSFFPGSSSVEVSCLSSSGTVPPSDWAEPGETAGERDSGSGPASSPGGTTEEGLDTDPLVNPDRKAISKCDGSTKCINENPLVVLIKLAINILSAVVGIVVVGVIIVAGIQYSSSGGNPQQAASSKKRIINAIIALVAYMFLFIGFQWLIPGGML